MDFLFPLGSRKFSPISLHKESLTDLPFINFLKDKMNYLYNPILTLDGVSYVFPQECIIFKLYIICIYYST